ncbi:MAG: ferrous iron transport protein A [Clostridia bacterium]|nr:ferrous iron transport protein A [Clostridia bacterium]
MRFNREKRNARKGISENPTTLYEVKVGQTVWVTSVDVEDPNMRRRLQDLGIINGTRILCKQMAPSGNPKAYLVRGATVAIRKADSELIRVTTKAPADYNPAPSQNQEAERASSAYMPEEAVASAMA